MEFPALQDQVETLIEHLRIREKFAYSELNIVASPYRISPLGAHIDHQGGPVLGMTINARTLLAFAPNDERRIRLYSTNYPGIVEFGLDNIRTTRKDDWGRYAMGAAKIIQEHMAIEVGFTGAVTGSLPASGLSSSASVGLAYLKALSHLNNYNLTPDQYVCLDSGIENKYLKLQNGILDQSSIIHGKKDQLLYIDTKSKKVIEHPRPESGKEFKILILYTGLSHELTSSGFNERVEACKRTAGLLGLMGGLKSPSVLSDIPSEVYEAQKKRLPEDVKNWAAHYFSEVGRVEQGIEAWNTGDIDKFGQLMNESSISTIENYDRGSPEAKRLFELSSLREGVYGAAINGGGYGGCVVAFVRNEITEDSATEIMNKYTNEYPNVKETAAAYFAEAENGLELL